LLLLGAFFLVVAAVGLLRMPDLFMRMSTSTKASVLCVGLILAGGAVHFADLAVTARVIAVVVFVGLTAPIAAHMIGRAAYREGIALWKGTFLDELRGRYSAEPSEPASPESTPGPPAS
jgi:multicomponent Na+:H+ antiporter subunit G